MSYLFSWAEMPNKLRTDEVLPSSEILKESLATSSEIPPKTRKNYCTLFVRPINFGIFHVPRKMTPKLSKSLGFTV